MGCPVSLNVHTRHDASGTVKEMSAHKVQQQGMGRPHVCGAISKSAIPLGYK